MQELWGSSLMMKLLKKSAAFNRQLKDMEQTGKRLAIMIGQELLPVVMEYAQGAIDFNEVL